MNHITIIGRVTKDPEVRYSQGNEPIAYGSYTVAVDRPRAKDKETVTDFIYCKVVGRAAEFAEKYLRKGMKIAIEGRLHVDTYKDRDGNTKSTTYVHVTSHEFCESKNKDMNASPEPQGEYVGDGFVTVPESLEEELPWS